MESGGGGAQSEHPSSNQHNFFSQQTSNKIWSAIVLHPQKKKLGKKTGTRFRTASLVLMCFIESWKRNGNKKKQNIPISTVLEIWLDCESMWRWYMYGYIQEKREKISSRWSTSSVTIISKLEYVPPGIVYIWIWVTKLE